VSFHADLSRLFCTALLDLSTALAQLNALSGR